MTDDTPPATGASLAQRAAAFMRSVAPGAAFAAVIALAASQLTNTYGGPVMLYALLIGIAFHFIDDEPAMTTGLRFASSSVLRLGVALLGAQIAWSDVAHLGVGVVAIVIGGVATTIVVGGLIGRMLKIPHAHAILSAGAVAICGASAALAISAVLPRSPSLERDTSLTVVGVTALSSIAMVVYPVLATLFQFDDRIAGVFLGATIHDVAQVVGAGYLISDTAGETATIVKLLRVASLAPAVIFIGLSFGRGAGEMTGEKRPPLMPWFVIGFFALMIANSFAVLPTVFVETAGTASRACLITAVAALGLRTSMRALVAVGPRPLVMMALQTVFLLGFALAGLAIIDALS